MPSNVRAEAEAREKTCHRTLGPVASADGSAPWFSPQPCIGSQCSAWLWDNENLEKLVWYPQGFFSPNEPKRPVDVPPDAEWVGGLFGHWIESDASLEARRPAPLGYCGIVGK